MRNIQSWHLCKNFAPCFTLLTSLDFFNFTTFFQANRETVMTFRSIDFRLLKRIKFSAMEGVSNSTIARPPSLMLMLRTLPHAVVMALTRSKLIVVGKLEIITRLLVPPAIVIFGATPASPAPPPTVWMLRKLGFAELCCAGSATIRIWVSAGAGLCDTVNVDLGR